MPLITDGDVTRGFIWERALIRRLYELTFTRRSPMFRGYIEGMSKTTGLPPETLLRSQPVRNFLRKLAGAD